MQCRGIVVVTAMLLFIAFSVQAAEIDVLNKQLGRGINLGNALEAPTEGAWGLKLDAQYFREIKQAGFDSIRLPVRWSAHAQGPKPYSIDAAFLGRVDWALDQAKLNNLRVVLNVHHYDELYKHPDIHRDRFLGIWQQLAEHYQEYGDWLYFEILNEPNDTNGNRLGAEAWNDLLTETLTVIRRTNPTRPVIVGGSPWNGYQTVDTLRLPAEDRNLIVTFHYYLPFHFTHQGASWAQGANAWLGTAWQGSEAERSEIKSHFEHVAMWAEKEQRPVYLGEFGAYQRAGLADRSRWTAAVARTAESLGFSWAYWEFGSGFGAYDPKRQAWNEPIREALVP
jgi:endoglucanase